MPQVFSLMSSTTAGEGEGVSSPASPPTPRRVSRSSGNGMILAMSSQRSGRQPCRQKQYQLQNSPPRREPEPDRDERPPGIAGIRRRGQSLSGDDDFSERRWNACQQPARKRPRGYFTRLRDSAGRQPVE